MPPDNEIASISGSVNNIFTGRKNNLTNFFLFLISPGTIGISRIPATRSLLFLFFAKIVAVCVSGTMKTQGSTAQHWITLNQKAHLHEVFSTRYPAMRGARLGLRYKRMT